MPSPVRGVRVSAVEERQPRAAPESFATAAELTVLCAGAAGIYLALRYGAPGIPESVPVAVPFLALPLAAIVLLKGKLDLGKPDWTLALSAAAYTPFAAIAAAAAPSVPGYYIPLAASVATPALAVAWALDTFFHVGAVDFFTRRIVQTEAHARFGAQRALAIAFAVWCGAHVIEWFWLRALFGEVGAALYLGAAGVVTGFAYLRWRNVLGLMLGHFLVNVAAAGAAVAVYR